MWEGSLRGGVVCALAAIFVVVLCCVAFCRGFSSLCSVNPKQRAAGPSGAARRAPGRVLQKSCARAPIGVEKDAVEAPREQLRLHVLPAAKEDRHPRLLVPAELEHARVDVCGRIGVVSWGFWRRVGAREGLVWSTAGRLGFGRRRPTHLHRRNHPIRATPHGRSSSSPHPGVPRRSRACAAPAPARRRRRGRGRSRR